MGGGSLRWCAGRWCRCGGDDDGGRAGQLAVANPSPPSSAQIDALAFNGTAA